MDSAAEFITTEEAIDRLGISRATFYNHAKELERFRRVGDRRVLYRTTDIEQMAELQPRVRDAVPADEIVYKVRGRRRTSPPKT